ncbi:MAG: hypothetical protein U5L96_06285 [Owenweeksia sp.]|nr:hypothetical protein [Owenweeksia sp.]
MNKKAAILGASGLVGAELLKKLLAEDSYQEVVAYVRTPLEVEHPKLTEKVGDLLEDTFFDGLAADDVFCCIGTTQAKTPDLSTYKNVDYGIPVRAARAGLRGA